ncbi:MAG: DUF4124 domain-containing protein [Chromatiales bacterium]
MLKQIATALLLLLSFGANAEFYKWTDASGTVHYTDKRPQESGSEPVVLPKTMFYTPPSTASGTSGISPDKLAGPDAIYQRFEILRPVDGKTVRNNRGDVTVVVAIDPELSATHSLQLLLDGVVIGSTQTTSMLLQNVDRGTHRLQASIINGAGVVLLSARSISFELKQESQIEPQPPEVLEEAYKPRYEPGSADDTYNPSTDPDTYKPGDPDGYDPVPGGGGYKPNPPAKPYKPTYTPSYNQ